MANLKALISDDAEIRTHIAEAVKVYEHQLARISGGVSVAQILDPTSSHRDVAAKSAWAPLSVMERQLLQEHLSRKYGGYTLEDWQATALMMDRISLNGVRYARTDVFKSDGESHIIFEQPGTNRTSPGKIVNIFRYWHTPPNNAAEIEVTYLVVQRFVGVSSLELGRQDPYNKISKVFGYLASQVVANCNDLIETTHVKSHFASTPIAYNGLNLIHVLPLNRVSAPRLLVF